MTEKRATVTHLARQYRQVGFPPSSQEDAGRVSGLRFSEYYKEVKDELYALTAVVADPVIRKPYEDRANRPPFGLTTVTNTRKFFSPSAAPPVTVEYGHFDSQVPFVSLSDFTRDTLFRSLLREGREMGGDEQQRPILKRLDYLVDQLARKHPEDENRYSGGILGYVSGGINFGLLTMAGTLDLIPRLAPDATTEQKVDIAHNSFSLIKRLSAGELEQRIRQVSALAIPLRNAHFLFNVANFQVKEVNGVSMLELSDAGEALFAKYEPSAGADVIGCPAGVVLQGESANKLLWNWHVEIGEKLFPLAA